MADPSYVVFRLGIAAKHNWLDVPLYLSFKAFILKESFTWRNVKRRKILEIERDGGNGI